MPNAVLCSKAFFTLLLSIILTASAMAGPHDVTTTQIYHHRPYILDKPAMRTNGQKLPMVIVLHGATGNARTSKRSLVHYMRQEIEKHHFMVAYLSGSPGHLLARKRTWNAGVCCGPAEWKNKNDVGYIADFIKFATKKHNVDPKRIYILGYSNGAMMAYRYICEKPNSVTAMVAISGTIMSEQCNPKGLKGILHIHGGEDQVVPVEGGTANVGLFRKEYYTPVSDVQSIMRDANVPFKFLFLEHVGHHFDETNAHVNVPATAWKFFKKFRR